MLVDKRLAYRRMIDAWSRQRAYVAWAVEALQGTPEVAPDILPSILHIPLTPHFVYLSSFLSTMVIIWPSLRPCVHAWFQHHAEDWLDTIAVIPKGKERRAMRPGNYLLGLLVQGTVITRGLAELAALQRTPHMDDSFKRLAPDSKLSFESHAWIITLDPASGTPLLPNNIATKSLGPVT